MRIDVGFNKPITPEMIVRDYPCLLRDDKKNPMPAPRLNMYPPETMIAEKMHAIAFFQAYNTRTRDYYDLYTLLGKFDFDDEILGNAIRRTFAKEDTVVPTEWAGLSVEYATDKEKDWKNFNKTTSFRDDTPDFKVVVSSILERMEAPLALAREASGMSI